MESSALVELALRAKACTQAALAKRMGVSPTQITKWKQGEHISSDMEKKLAKIAGIGTLDAEFVLAAGSIEDAMKWQGLLHHLADLPSFEYDVDVACTLLKDEENDLCRVTFATLKDMGVAIPAKFPKELDVDFEKDCEELDELIEENPHADLILKIYRSLLSVNAFYMTHVFDLLYEEDLGMADAPQDLDACLMDLAAAKIDVSEKLAPKFSDFRHKTNQMYAEQLANVKKAAMRSGVPLAVELLDLVHLSPSDLERMADAETLCENECRLHPDIYMNELLVGMRKIHQVLPVILKKLKIGKEFEFDESELHQPLTDWFQRMLDSQAAARLKGPEAP